MTNRKQNKFKITPKDKGGVKGVKLSPHVEHQLTMNSYEKWVEARRARGVGPKGRRKWSL